MKGIRTILSFTQEVTPVTTTSTTTSPVLALSIQAILYIGLAISIIAIVIIIITYLASRCGSHNDRDLPFSVAFTPGINHRDLPL